MLSLLQQTLTKNELYPSTLRIAFQKFFQTNNKIPENNAKTAPKDRT